MYPFTSPMTNIQIIQTAPKSLQTTLQEYPQTRPFTVRNISSEDDALSHKAQVYIFDEMLPNCYPEYVSAPSGMDQGSHTSTGERWAQQVNGSALQEQR